MSNILSGICKAAGTIAGAYFGGAAGAAVGYKGGELLGGLLGGNSNNTETASNTQNLNKALTIGKNVKEVASNNGSSKDIISTLADGLLGSDEKNTLSIIS